jgi:hypothetical protein
MAVETRRILIVALVATTSFACSGSDTTIGTGAPTSEAPMVRICPAQQSANWEVVDGVRPDFPREPDPVLLGVLESYGRDHPEAWAGLWLTPTDGKDNVSVGIVGDVDAHRDAILARSAQPDDVQTVHPAPNSSNTTTVAESTFTVEVVPVTRTLAELEELQEKLGREVTEPGSALDVSGFGARLDANVVYIGLPEVTDAARRQLAQQFDGSALCVEPMGRISPYLPPNGGTFPPIGDSVDD